MARPNNKSRNESAQLPRTMPFDYSLKLTLEEMFHGTKRLLIIPRNIVCGKCRGSGSTIPTNESYDTCELCHGEGVRIKVQRTSAESGVMKRCELCWGEGVAIVPEYRCGKCKGQKTVPNEVRVVCEVKPGTHDGDYLILRGKGQQVPNKRPGNIIVKMESVPHETFKRIGDDLLVTMPLDLVDALGGYDNFLTTLDKRRLHICIPRGNVITDNKTKIFLGHGMPKFENPREKGNLIIKFIVNLPNNIRVALAPKLEKVLTRREKVEIPFEAHERNMISMTTREIVNRLADREVIKEEKPAQPKDEEYYPTNHHEDECIHEPMDNDVPTGDEDLEFEGQIYIRHDDGALEQAWDEGAYGHDGDQFLYQPQPDYDDSQYNQYQYSPYDEVYNY